MVESGGIMVSAVFTINMDTDTGSELYLSWRQASADFYYFLVKGIGSLVWTAHNNLYFAKICTAKYAPEVAVWIVLGMAMGVDLSIVEVGGKASDPFF